jgi:DNA polymerase I
VRVIVSSGDKDLSQLVNEHITIIDTMNGKVRDVAGVTAEFGVPPSLMVDYQTLVGDTVDNVPGVEKVGPKTAAKWLPSTARSRRGGPCRADQGRGRARTCARRWTGCPPAGSW